MADYMKVTAEQQWDEKEWMDFRGLWKCPPTGLNS